MEVPASGLVALRGPIERPCEGPLDDGLLTDGTLAAGAAQAAASRQIRQGVTEVRARRGRPLRADVSIPISGIAAVLDG